MNVKLCTLFCLLLGISHLQATPEDAFTQIAAQLKAGEVEKALSSMTKKAKQEFISIAVEGVAEQIALGGGFPEKIVDGTKVTVTPADIGFDKVKFPKWFTDEEGPNPSEKQELEFFGELVGIIEKSEDRNKALKDLLTLSDLVEPNEFSGKIIPRPTDADYPKETIWVEIDYGQGEKDKVALKFKKVKDVWKYADYDWKTMEIEEKKFVEKKVLDISGKGLDGEDLSIKGLEGKVVLIDFWGTW